MTRRARLIRTTVRWSLLAALMVAIVIGVPAAVEGRWPAVLLAVALWGILIAMIITDHRSTSSTTERQ